MLKSGKPRSYVVAEGKEIPQWYEERGAILVGRECRSCSYWPSECRNVPMYETRLT